MIDNFCTGILFLIINSLEIFGVYAATYYFEDMAGIDNNSKMLLWELRWYSNLLLGEKLTKPLFSCPTCMASFHSLIFWIPIYIIMPLSFMLFYTHFIYVFALAGLNRLILSKFDI
jgi:hypothetical protein